MTRRILFFLCMAAAAAFAAAGPDSPFVLPLTAKVTETSADGKGWKAGGEVELSFEQAKAQFASRISAAGWSHLHSIPLGRDRVLETWTRRGQELTLMVWRLAPGRSGFSYGLSVKGN